MLNDIHMMLQLIIYKCIHVHTCINLEIRNMHKIFRWKIFSLLQIEVTMTLKLKNIYILFTFVPLSLGMSLRMTSASYDNSIYRLACSVSVHSLTTFWWGLAHLTVLYVYHNRDMTEFWLIFIKSSCISTDLSKP